MRTSETLLEMKRARNKRHYDKNRENIKAARKRRVISRQDAVDLRKSLPCTDCGGTFPPVAMDFDHMPEYEKVGSISRMLLDNRHMAIIGREIAKCELVCANCHRVRTKERR